MNRPSRIGWMAGLLVTMALSFLASGAAAAVDEAATTRPARSEAEVPRAPADRRAVRVTGKELAAQVGGALNTQEQVLRELDDLTDQQRDVIDDLFNKRRRELDRLATRLDAGDVKPA